MSEVQAITFQNDVGLRLFGTLHRPGKANDALPAVILLSPGVKMRVGPGRLYLPLTELMNSLGYLVLRFDFHGLGDSEGELEETMLADVYNHIEVGRYVGDTLSAMRWLREQHGCKRFMLGGLCGGAITALLAAERDSSVESLLSLGMTVTLASNAATPAKYLTRAQLDSRRQKYYRRLLEPKSWWRLLTFQSEYAVIWRSLKRLVIKEPPPAAKPSPAAATPAAIDQRGNANPLFPPAYFAFLQRGGKALMIFSEKDRLQSEYEEKFVAFHQQQLGAYQGQIDQHLIGGANHVLSFHEWRDEMLTRSRAWLAAASR
jgi:pimeloyl-ACP methyl ester carboxylesterase